MALPREYVGFEDALNIVAEIVSTSTGFPGTGSAAICGIKEVLKDFPILMLDEATSALDNMTQAKVQSAIENLRGKQTLIMIAHRLSTVINCDKLFLMSNGKVIAEGSHEELLKTCDVYREIFEIQKGGVK